MPATPIEEMLASLHAHYVERINAAVAAGQMDLVRELASGYEDEALELMLAVDGGTSIQPGYGTAESLDYVPDWPHGRGSGRWRSRFWRQRRR